jgi:DNA-binding FadR family transcriptional regulator
MIDKRSLTEETIRELTEQITVKKKYKLGDKLPNELILAEELGVSRTTLRDAISYLTSTNVLKRMRGKGTFVCDNQMLGEDFGFSELNYLHVKLKDLYEVRLVFEPEVTAIATQKATETEIDEILRLAKQIEDSEEESVVVADMNKKFHSAIAQATHNEFMIMLNENISTATVKAFDEEKIMQKNPEVLVMSHRLVASMMKYRDAEGAKLAMRLHIKQSVDYYNLK